MESFNLFIQDLTVLDVAILDPIRGPIGMSWKVGIQFIGKLNVDNVVFDFSIAKKTAKKIIDESADHTFIVNEDSIMPALTGYVSNNNFCQIELENLSYKAPRQALFIVPNTSEATIISKLESMILEECNKLSNCGKLLAVRITLTNEKTNNLDDVFFNYTHGLQPHFGNCCRLLHGHQSTINIYVDGERNKDLEKQVAQFYADKHLTYWKNINKITNEFTHIEYIAIQGKFCLMLPKEKVIKYPLETTIENISKYTTYWIKEQHPNLLNSIITVKAFEGIGKGCSYTLQNGQGTKEDLSKLWEEHDKIKSNRVPKNKMLIKG